MSCSAAFEHRDPAAGDLGSAQIAARRDVSPATSLVAVVVTVVVAVAAGAVAVAVAVAVADGDDLGEFESVMNDCGCCEHLVEKAPGATMAAVVVALPCAPTTC